jgi:hypothetical protein
MARSVAAKCVAELERLAHQLPEVEQRRGGEGARHVAFTVRSKTFCYFTDDHHGDGRLGLIVKAPPGEQGVLVGSEPERFYVPPYLGHRGWVGLWLDRAPVDWAEVRELFVESYCLTAPKRLVAALGELARET